MSGGEWSDEHDLGERVGRYRLHSLAGTGGFAIVVRARDELLESEVAIKILDRRWQADADIRDRFVQEARLIRRIRNSHVIAVHDIGELDDGRPYFVMDYADGGALSSRLDADVGADPASIARIIAEMAEGLAAFHDAGVVHRDVNPRNLLIINTASRAPTSSSSLLAPTEQIRIGDLGLAKDQQRSSIGATIMGGSPGFASPEQLVQTVSIGAAADIFGATATLWLLLTGTLPPAIHELTAHLAGIDERWRDFFISGFAAEAENRQSSILDWRDEALSIIDQAHSRRVGSTVVTPASAMSCPFKGLAAFQPEDAELFFGRAELVNELVRKLAADRTLVIAGPSGSGKSSALRAGLIPAIGKGSLPTSQNWEVILFSPGSDPLRELAFQLNQLQRTVAMISADELIAEPRLVRRFASAGLMVAIDQFEELFTMSEGREQVEAFLDVLRELVDPAESKARLVIAMRADFYNTAASYPWLEHLINTNQVLLGPICRGELREAIVGPARFVGLSLEDGLVDAMLDEAGAEPGSLPLISHALVETWANRRGRLLTLDGLAAAGGVSGAVARSAESLFDKSFDDAEKLAARRIMLRLVTPGDGTPDTRRRMPLSELEADPRPAVAKLVADRLVKARLLTIDDETIDIAHEALITSWPRFRQWIDDERTNLRERHRIGNLATTWRDQQRDPDALARGNQLATISQWVNDNPDQLNSAEAEFVDESLVAETASRNRSRRLRRMAIGGLSVLAAGATIASIIAFFALRDSRSNEMVAQTQTALGLATQAQSLTNTEPLLALALATQSEARIGPSVASRAALLEANLQLDSAPFRQLGGPLSIGDAQSIAIRPDGLVAAVGSRGGLLQLLDVRSKELLGESDELTDGNGIEELTFSPDGSSLAIAGSGGNVYVLDTSSPDRLVPAISIQLGTIAWSVAFNSDGSRLVATTEDRTVAVLDPQTGAELASTKLPNDVISVAVGPSDRFVAAGTGKGTLFLLDANDLSVIWSIAPHDQDIWEIVFSSDGLNLLTGDVGGQSRWITVSDGSFSDLSRPDTKLFGLQISANDQTIIAGDSKGRVQLIDVASTMTTDSSPTSHSDSVVDAALSADGNTFVTLGRDNDLRAWDMSANNPSVISADVAGSAGSIAMSTAGDVVAVGRTDGVVSLLRSDDLSPIAEFEIGSASTAGVEFDADGEILLVATTDGAVSVVEFSDGRWAGPRSLGEHRGVLAATLSDDGSTAVTVGKNGELRVWSIATGAVLFALKSDSGGEALAVRFRPDSRTVVVAEGGSIQLWDIASGKPKGAPLIVHDDLIFDIAVSNDGNLLAVALADSSVQIWDLDSRKRSPARPLTPNPDGGQFLNVEFTPDDATVVVAGAGSAQLYEAASGARIGTSLIIGEGETYLAMWSDKPVFVTADGQGTVRTWWMLDQTRACELSIASFDKTQQLRYLGENELLPC
ncbi:MAG: WD40 repeat domain-containing serine/threonine-protein kinase [Acidimicrobiales bacterium]